MLNPRPARLRILPRLIAVIAGIYAFCWVSGFPREYDDDELPQKPNSPHNSPKAALDQVVVSIKTTALDAFTKLPPILIFTNSIYYDTLLLMSDLETDIGGFHIHDVFHNCPEDFIATNPDFERYRQQVNMAQHSIDLGLLREQDERREQDIIDKLDKYKYLRMLEKAWELKPKKSWYVFVDTDTHVFRNNLYTWLGRYDPRTPTWFGNPPRGDDPDPFGYGGTMFVLSGEAMRQLLVAHKNVVAEWDARIADHDSGFDVLFSVLSSQLDLGVDSMWPELSGFNPKTLPYGPDIWCEEVVALGNIQPDDASEAWRLERERTEWHHIRTPLTFEDVWKRFIQPEDMFLPRENWDNLSSGPGNAKYNILFEGMEHNKHADAHLHRHEHRDAVRQAQRGEDSWEACRESCNNHERCVQFSYSSTPAPNWNANGETRCHLSTSMRMGGFRDAEEVKLDGQKERRIWKSGWRRDRFEDWAKQQRCKNQQN
ncbi:glycosyltransferase family 31 protein [Zopfia rhizophila CBS 207.26]|uniref:Glycosyltransferase family 31 protein n=1 Tax=Zopfia rhizophila CBS 207.26 TaxID=1314779 RepID=A0A6A6DS60_9PEZI|nr:glycosyltransferase family 31 protein [Zopfia rhizophila CBS 207.26]